MNLIAACAYLSTASADFEQKFSAKLHLSEEANSAIAQQVSDIVAHVRQRGDAAVLEYTARWDGRRDRKSTRLNSSHRNTSRMPSSA